MPLKGHKPEFSGPLRGGGGGKGGRRFILAFATLPNRLPHHLEQQIDQESLPTHVRKLGHTVIPTLGLQE